MIPLMLSSEEAWSAVSFFIKRTINKKREMETDEKNRAKDRTNLDKGIS